MTRPGPDPVPEVVPLTVTATPAFSLRQKASRWARRTEGRLTLLLAGLVVLGVLAAVVGAWSVRDRAGLLDEVTGGPPAGAARHTPSGAARDLYLALADADATAAGTFLPGAFLNDQLAHYRRDIATATAALTAAAATAGSSTVVDLPDALSIYTGQVEVAVLALNRPGLRSDMASLLGATYLRDPAVQARESLLPKASALFADRTGRLTAAQRGAAEPPWFGLALGVLLVGCLVATQVYLTRRTRRRFNAYLLVATAAAVGGVSWLGAASAVSTSHAEASRRDGTAQVEVLVEARAAGLRARSNEVMTLVEHANGPEYFDERFDAEAARLTGAGGLLAKARSAVTQRESLDEVNTAADALQRWLTAHRQVRELDRTGHPAEAIALLGGGVGDLATAFDTQLAQAIQQAGDRLDASARSARDALSLADTGVAGLMALAVLGAVLGLWKRIAEYR